MCATTIIQPKTGRRRKFCSNACRLHYHRALPGQRNKITYQSITNIVADYHNAKFRCIDRSPSLRQDGVSLHCAARPLALDLFCGAGGASMGLNIAGFDVIGVDHHKMPEYPFRFIQADALVLPLSSLQGFDLIWASPPCQAYSVCNNYLQRDYPDLVDEVRSLLVSAGVPYIIENVPGAPLNEAVALTGEMFGLDIIRRRHFECSQPVVVPLRHPTRGKVIGGGYFTVAGNGGGSVAQLRVAMGINWMKRNTLTQAVPPAYAWFLAKQFTKAIDKT